jgi:hypothetical protein
LTNQNNTPLYRTFERLRRVDGVASSSSSSSFDCRVEIAACHATDYVVSEAHRPLPPFNVTAQWLRSSVHIAWQPAAIRTQIHSSGKELFEDGASYAYPPPRRYYIEYRTVGHWVPLVDVSANNTQYDWTTASRGATYHFRVMSGINDELKSEPSAEVVIRTTGPCRFSLRRYLVACLMRCRQMTKIRASRSAVKIPLY